MRTVRVTALSLVFSISLSLPLCAQTTMLGGTGLLRIQDVESLVPGQMGATSHFLGFFQARESSSMLAKDVTINMGLTFAFSETCELTAAIALYQDDNTQLVPMPGDSRLGVKINALKGEVMRLGLYPFVNFPTAEKHNVPFETYSPDNIALGMMGIAMIDLKETFPLFPIKLYLNAGYLDNNLQDQYFSSKIDQGLVGIGFKIPIRSSVLFTEYTAELFLNNPDVRWSNNPQRITQGFRFLAPWGLVCDIGVDVDLSQLDSKKQDEMYHKQYADWKVIAGISHRFTLLPYLSREERLERRRRMEEAKRLEQIRKQREQAARELEEMKNKLKKPPPHVHDTITATPGMRKI